MNKFYTIFLFVNALFITINLSAQTKTPYQKKTEALKSQVLRELGINPSTIKNYTDAGDMGTLFFLSNVSDKLQTQKGMLAYLRYKQGLKSAEKLKNAIDFKHDANKRAVEARKKAVYLAKEQDRQEQKELAKKEEQHVTNFENSDYVKIGKQIKSRFEKWAQKGEFEKTVDYENRIVNESSNQFTIISFTEISEKTYSYSQENKNSNSGYKWLSIQPKTYDADNELYYISISQQYIHHDEITGTINISPPEALHFKAIFNSYEQIIDANDWIFSKHNLMPSKILLTTKSQNTEKGQFIVNLSLQDKKPIIFSTRELKIDIPNLPSISFNYTLQASSIIESERLRKLEKKVAEEEELKQKKVAEQQKYEEKKTVELEARFSSLVNRADNGVYNDVFKDKTLKDIPKAQIDKFSLYINSKIELYQEALKVKDDSEIRRKLVQYQAFQKEIQEKKQKREKMIRVIDGILS